MLFSFSGVADSTKDLFRGLKRNRLSAKEVRMLIKMGARVNADGEYGQKPLHHVRDPDVTRVLIEAGANVHETDELGGWTPLHRVLISAEVARVLIEAGAKVNAKDKYGKTPLHWVFNPELARVLIEAGAEVNARDNRGEIPLHNARDPNVARVLIEAGSEVNAKDKEGRTPLHNAKDPDVARVLLEAGANVHAKDKEGRTPLHNAKDPDVARVLLEAGAEVNAKDKDGRTPLHDADNIELVRVLIEAGANVHAKDKEGRTPFEENVNVRWLFARDSLANKLVREPSKISGCEYLKDPLKITSTQFGDHNICIADVYCKFQLNEDFMLKRKYQAFCNALKNNKCPSATHCAISNKVWKKRDDSDEILLSPRSSKKRKTRGV